MFKPVTGDAVAQFDPETVELFKRRPADPTQTAIFAMLPRRSRHHLPVVVDKDNEVVKDMEKFQRSFMWKLFLGFGIFSKYSTYQYINEMCSI